MTTTGMTFDDTKGKGVDPQVLGEYTWKIGDLASSYPPRWTNANKQLIADMVGDDKSSVGKITASRWALPDQAELPEKMQQCRNVRLEHGFFAYPPQSPDDRTTAWHMNFADPWLFGYGEGPLLAQDELQIVEHPILCSLAKAIEVGEHGQLGLTRHTTRPGARTATPVLVQGAPRRCHLNTTELYGNAFARAPQETVQAAVEVLPRHRTSNIVAVASLPPRSGCYTKDQINAIYETAYTGYRATVLRSPGGRVTIHTGHWGCGAFGGNKGLVAAIQILAAGAARVEQLVYWYGSTVLDKTAVEHGIQVAAFLHGREKEEALQLLDAAGYRWGAANENHVPYCPPDSDLIQIVKREHKDESSNMEL